MVLEERLLAILPQVINTFQLCCNCYRNLSCVSFFYLYTSQKREESLDAGPFFSPQFFFWTKKSIYHFKYWVLYTTVVLSYPAYNGDQFTLMLLVFNITTELKEGLDN